MSFLWPDMLWALLIVPALVAGYILAQRRRQKYALRYASLSLLREVLPRGPGARRHIPPALLFCAIAIMVFALARPVALVMLPSQQSTIILAIDVSGSMRAQDLQPNRLEAAKEAARAFVENQPPSVRIGLVSFSGGATLVQPPTTDHAELDAAIDRLAWERSTAIGSGILTSVQALLDDPSVGASPTPDTGALGQSTAVPSAVPPGSYKSGAIVLLSDGQSNVGPRPLDVINEAATRGVRVYTVGVGSPQGVVLGLEGRSIRVRLDEQTLQRIAEDTGGTYARAGSEGDLRQIYQNLSSRLVLEPQKIELTAGFTGAAILFVLAAGTLSLLWFNRLP